MLEILKTIWFVIVYIFDWSCQHKRAYWFKVLTDDIPVVGLDFSVLAAWVWYPEIIAIVGQGIGITAGLLGIYLTGLRIVHVRKQIKALDNPDPKQDEIA